MFLFEVNTLKVPFLELTNNKETSFVYQGKRGFFDEIC